MTLRKLLLMARSRQEEDWNHTSHVLAMLANTRPFRSADAPLVEPADMNPLIDRPALSEPSEEEIAENWADLKAAVKQMRG